MGAEKPDAGTNITPVLKETDRRFEQALKEAKSVEDFNRDIDEIQRSIKQMYEQSNPGLVQQVERAAEKAKEMVKEADIDFTKRNDENRTATISRIRGIFIEGGHLEQNSLETKYDEIIRFIDNTPDPDIVPINPESLGLYLKNLRQIANKIRAQQEQGAPLTLLKAQINQLYDLLPPRNKSPESKSLLSYMEKTEKAREGLNPYAAKIAETIARIIKNNKTEDRIYLKDQFQALMEGLKKPDMVPQYGWLYVTSMENGNPLAMLASRDDKGAISIHLVYGVNAMAGAPRQNGQLAELTYHEGTGFKDADSFFTTARNSLPPRNGEAEKLARRN